jgi:hypothetical protein
VEDMEIDAWVVALATLAIVVVACGGGDETGTSGKEGGERILIKTDVAPLNARGETTGEVLSGSTIGDSAFCAEGTFADAPGGPPVVVKRSAAAVAP